MKRALLGATLCLTGLALLPVASASALTGACTVNGKATFYTDKTEATKTKLTETEPAPTRGYKFKGEATCAEASGAPVKSGEAVVEKGDFKGTCLGLGKSGAEGEGELRFGSKPKFKLAFVSV